MPNPRLLAIVFAGFVGAVADISFAPAQPTPPPPKRYPSEARAQGEHGIARVAFTIHREGRRLTSSILQSSGSAALDQETLEVLSRVQPLPKLPGYLEKRRIVNCPWSCRYASG
jgi:TonB family protein